LDTYDLEEENLDDTEKGQSENKILARLAEAILFDFVDNFGITLPEPDVAKFESQAAALEEYIKFLDATSASVAHPLVTNKPVNKDVNNNNFTNFIWYSRFNQLLHNH
jgi:hypothetical protein